MNLIDRVLSEPEFQAIPPVLVDVGAAGGVHGIWRRIAKHAVGVGFEPDAREARPLDAVQSRFRRWVFCPVAVSPQAGKSARLNLTRSPQCSSMLEPDEPRLSEWVFADQFQVTSRNEVPAATLAEALAAVGVDRVDWLKLDTQGMDLAIFRSLPDEWRERLLVVEFEPGLLDAYL